MNIRKFKWILAFAGAVVVVLLLRGFAFTSYLIPSTGMENSIFQGERILVNKWSDFQSYKQFEKANQLENQP